MIGALTSLPGKIIVVLALICAVWAGGYLSGRQAGKTAQLNDTIEAFQQREKINAHVDSRSDYRLCIDLGGVPEQCGELRRVDKAPGSK